MTASASGGLGAALEALADTYLASGIAPQVLHRVAAVAAGGLDSLPYNGATITVLALVGMTHKESYLDMFVVSVVIPLIAAFALAALASMGICF
jgi:H+/gluconate symporter-like permease